MKKSLYAIVALLLMTSCSPTYYGFMQVGKLSSDNVEINDAGRFTHTRPELTIAYNFWSYGGEVSFCITNTSDNDIYLLMDKSFFIQNGVAYDYFKNRTYISHKSSSSATTIGAAASANAQLYGNLSYWEQLRINSIGANVNYSSASVGYAASVNQAYSSSSQKGYSIEFPESSTICIPAHSSKIFSEFSISDAPYRKCGFARDPKNTDGENITFSKAEKSPEVIENRLVFNINGQEVPVINTFYVSEYINIHDGAGYAYTTDYSTDCNGKKLSSAPDIKIYKHSTPNCFYTKYKCIIGYDNDRIKTKKK